MEEKIRTQLAAPYIVDGEQIVVALSRGTAVFPVDARDHRELIRLADAAMYSMKHKSRTVVGAEGPPESIRILSDDQGA